MNLSPEVRRELEEHEIDLDNPIASIESIRYDIDSLELEDLDPDEVVVKGLD